MTITFTLIQTAFFIYFYAHWNLQFCTLCIFHYLTVRDMTLHDFIMSMHQIAHFHTTKLLNTNNLQTGFQNGLGITCQPADGRLKHQVTPTVLSRAFDVSTMVCILCKKKASEDGVSWYPPKLGPKTPSVETVWDGYQLFFSLLEMELLPPPPILRHMHGVPLHKQVPWFVWFAQAACFFVFPKAANIRSGMMGNSNLWSHCRALKLHAWRRIHVEVNMFFKSNCRQGLSG